MCTLLITLCCPVAGLIANAWNGTQLCTYDSEGKKYFYFLALKPMIIMVVFSDMDEPDSLFLLIGVNGEVTCFSSNLKQLKKLLAFISSSKLGVTFYVSLCDVDSHALTAK